MNSEYIASLDNRILVTGSNGFIGTKVIEILLEYGFSNIRCLVRSSSRLGRLEQALSSFDAGRDVEIVTGDLLSREDCRKATQDVSVIIHLAAGMEKSFAGAFMNSALGYAQFDGCISRSWKAKAVRECQFLCGLFEFELKA